MVVGRGLQSNLRVESCCAVHAQAMAEVLPHELKEANRHGDPAPGLRFHTTTGCTDRDEAILDVEFFFLDGLWHGGFCLSYEVAASQGPDPYFCIFPLPSSHKCRKKAKKGHFFCGRCTRVN